MIFLFRFLPEKRLDVNIKIFSPSSFVLISYMCNKIVMTCYKIHEIYVFMLWRVNLDIWSIFPLTHKIGVRSFKDILNSVVELATARTRTVLLETALISPFDSYLPHHYGSDSVYHTIAIASTKQNRGG